MNLSDLLHDEQCKKQLVEHFSSLMELNYRLKHAQTPQEKLQLRGLLKQEKEKFLSFLDEK